MSSLDTNRPNVPRLERVYGWVIGIRRHKNVTFIDIDSYGKKVQVVVDNNKFSDIIDVLHSEALVEVQYERVNGKDNVAHHIKIINSSKGFYSYLRCVDPYSPKTLNKRHLLFKNTTFRKIIKLRAKTLSIIRDFLKKEGFVVISTPVIAPVTYYGKEPAFKVKFYKYEAFLNQCAAYYLEAALLGFNKVYSIVPSFRAEKVRSPRYLCEYWHLKGEIAFYNLNDIINFIEKFIYHIVETLWMTEQDTLLSINKSFEVEKFKPPYQRIDYDEAVEIVRRVNKDFKRGRSIGSDEEKILSKLFEKPFWVMYLPRSTQPFPYRLHPERKDKTLTADLIVPQYGEILGVAEKIYSIDELMERIESDGVPDNDIEPYKWYIELRYAGMPPHSGFGMGIERFLRAVLAAPHVRDVIPFPRLYGRKPIP